MTTPARQRETENTDAMISLVRQTALAQWAVALSEIEYETRAEAIQARADVNELFSAELERLSARGYRGHAVYAGLVELRGRVTEFITRKMADIAPVIVIEAPKSMPALYWAQRIYGDANRAPELVARNGTIHPGFMPREFEALSR